MRTCPTCGRVLTQMEKHCSVCRRRRPYWIFVIAGLLIVIVIMGVMLYSLMFRRSEPQMGSQEEMQNTKVSVGSSDEEPVIAPEVVVDTENDEPEEPVLVEIATMDRVFAQRRFVADSSPMGFGVEPYTAPEGVLSTMRADLDDDGEEELWVAEIIDDYVWFHIYRYDNEPITSVTVMPLRLNDRVCGHWQLDVFTKEYEGRTVLYCSKYLLGSPILDGGELQMQAYYVEDGQFVEIDRIEVAGSSFYPGTLGQENSRMLSCGLNPLQKENGTVDFDLTKSNSVDVLGTICQSYPAADFNWSAPTASSPLELEILPGSR